MQAATTWPVFPGNTKKGKRQHYCCVHVNCTGNPTSYFATVPPRLKSSFRDATGEYLCCRECWGGVPAPHTPKRATRHTEDTNTTPIKTRSSTPKNIVFETPPHKKAKLSQSPSSKSSPPKGPMCDLCEKCVVEVDRLPILPEDPRHNIVQMIRPRLLKLPTKPLDANISLCRKCRDNVEALRDIFTSLCERAEVVAPTPLTLWPGAKATIATSTGRSKQGTTEASAPSQGPDVFAPPSPVASPSSPVSPSSSSSSPGITYSEKRVRLPNPGPVQLGRLQGQYNISALGSAAAGG